MQDHNTRLSNQLDVNYTAFDSTEMNNIEALIRYFSLHIFQTSLKNYFQNYTYDDVHFYSQ